MHVCQQDHMIQHEFQRKVFSFIYHCTKRQKTQVITSVFPISILWNFKYPALLLISTMTTEGLPEWLLQARMIATAQDHLAIGT